MSSPRAAAAGRRAKRVIPPNRSRTGEHSVSAEAKRVAAQVEQALSQGRTDALTPDALHALMAAACKLYTAQIEAGQDVLPLGPRSSVSPTEVMTTSSGLLRSVNLAVFELGMWQSWTGR
jgi:hypothetical protein